MEDYLRRGFYPENRASQWIAREIDSRWPSGAYMRYAEFLVSDYKTTASAIDILITDSKSNAIIIDVKTGNFDREYCSWQLGVYKRLLEIEGDFTVKGCFVASTKDKFFYNIIPKSQERVDDLFGLSA